MKKREQDAVTYLWRDRRRVLGMPITFTRYALSEDRLFVERGLLTTHLEEVLLYRVPGYWADHLSGTADLRSGQRHYRVLRCQLSQAGAQQR